MVNSAFQNNPLCGGRDYRYAPRLGRVDSRGGAMVAPPQGAFKGSERLMNKVAIVTAAVLALGLAACNKNNADNNAANETAVENTASTDVNAATANTGAEANADAALNAAGNSVDNSSNAVANVANTSTNQ